MPDEILYCTRCGKRIPPEEAEAEDFRVEGGEPACGKCLEQVQPDRKRRLAEVRSTRLRMRAERVAAVGRAGTPKQTYPPPGTDVPRPATGTAIAAVRRALEEDEVTAIDPAVAAEELSAHTQPPASRSHLLWWALLAAGLLSIAVMLCWPTGNVPDRPSDEEGGQPVAVPDGRGGPRDPPEAPEVVPLSPVRLALAEVELIRTQVGEAPAPAAAEVAIAKLRQIARDAGEPARSAARDLCARYEAELDAFARQAAREAAERAEDLAAMRQYDAAVEHLRGAVRELPGGSVWSENRGSERLNALIERWSQERRRRLSAWSARLESELAAGNGGRVEALVLELADHPEKAFRELAQAYAHQLAALREREAQQQREGEEAARSAWPRFFEAYDTALAARDFEAALTLCRPAADAPLRRGGVAQPEAVLAGFAEDVARVRGLFPLALAAAAKRTGERIQLRLLTGQVEGTIRGVEGGQIVLMAGNRVEVRILPEKLSSEALAVLLLDAPRAQYGPALAALRFAETGRDAADRQVALAALYQEIGAPLPACWAQRFGFERRLRWRETLTPKLADLRKALDGGRVQVVRDALAQLRPWLEGGTLTEEERELVAAANKLSGGGRVVQLVLQNGRSPTPDFQGVRIDQIGAYYKNADKCDVGLEEGLRVGSVNDLQRILIRFDGLPNLLGRGRLIKATLEFHQLASAEAAGAVIALYPLKRPWSPDAGTWLAADREQKLPWEKPGASGTTDAEGQPVAQVVLDGQQDLWRSWDVTAYLRGVLEGKMPPHGLLMKVAQDEPRFGVRFYPDGEIAPAPQNAALRPRLVVEFEKFGP